MSKYKGQFIFVKHKNRATYEIPGGKKETGENIDSAAKRELFEETGAKKFKIEPVAIYRIKKNNYKYFGKLFYAEISELSEREDNEIGEILITNEIPTELTYPLIQPYILERIDKFLNEKCI